MELFRQSIYYAEKDREQYFRDLFVSGVKSGLNSNVLLALAMLPQLQKETFLIDSNKLNDDVKNIFKAQTTSSREDVSLGEVEVNFCYFMLKHNQSELLKSMVSSDDDQPLVAPPYQRINIFDTNGNETLHLVFYDKVTNGKPFTKEQGLEMIKNGLSIQFNNPYLKLIGDSLPNYIEPIHQNEVSRQLRFLYHLDGSIKSMAEQLYSERGINLVASYPSIIPENKNNRINKNDLFGLGEDMDSDYWNEMAKQRNEYAEAHKDELNENQANFKTTVENVWDMGKTSQKSKGGMK